MAKVHIAANKGLNGTPLYARFAAQNIGNGIVRRNNRSTYRFMASKIVQGVAAFKAIPENDRCAHCMAMALETRNIQRREKGLPPVAGLFD